MSNPQEQAIISEVLSGQYEEYRFLVDRYHRGLIQHLYNMTQDGQVAEDLAQEAFIRAYDKLAQYNPDYAFSTWLFKIADNLTYRYLKQTRLTRDIDDIEELIPDDKPSLGELTDQAFTKAAVREAVAGLPAQYKKVIGLYYWDNLSYEEIATIMERPVGTVRTWLHRAKEQLRKDLYGQV
jgi:RNA polymerase sigma-70 factor (ECF subfamily)